MDDAALDVKRRLMGNTAILIQGAVMNFKTLENVVWTALHVFLNILLLFLLKR